MDLQIAGQIALVTGGANGLGAEMCVALAEEGVQVVVLDRDTLAHDHADLIRERGGRAVGVTCDVTRPEEVSSVVNRIVKEFGRIDILVNCAGMSRDASITDMTDDQWLDVINVNLNANFYLVRAVAPFMKEQRYGRIVNISSRARTGDRFKANYSASKAGVVGLTMALAIELGKEGITVNAIAPGFCETARARSLPHYPEIKERALRLTPTDRLGNERDVADGLLYLVGRRSGYITGEVLTIAGGRWR